MTVHDDHQRHPAHGADHQDDGLGHSSRRDYVAGFLLASVLTVIPFWMVMDGSLPPLAIAITVVVLAFVQIVVHTYFFLHVNTQSEEGWTLMTLTFTGVIIAIVISGSLWIMYHLHENMMPMAPMPPAPPEVSAPLAPETPAPPP